jgi:hypothetical protein
MAAVEVAMVEVALVEVALVEVATASRATTSYLGLCFDYGLSESVTNDPLDE